MEKTLTLEGELREGFTALPNAILLSPSLSPSAKVLFALLLHHAWQGDSCFPGYDRLMELLPVGSKGTLSGLLRELEEAGLMETQRRGRGMTNLYTLRLKSKNRTSRSTEIVLQEVQKLDSNKTQENKTEDTIQQRTVGALISVFPDLPPSYAGKLAKDYLSLPAFTPEDLPGRAESLRQKWAGTKYAVTPNSLLKNWSLTHERPAGSLPKADDLADAWEATRQ